MLAEPAQILSYNSLSVYNSLSDAIHLYMIWALNYNFKNIWWVVNLQMWKIICNIFQFSTLCEITYIFAPILNISRFGNLSFFGENLTHKQRDMSDNKIPNSIWKMGTKFAILQI